MKRILVILLLGLSNVALATTYYVSSSAGSDTNGGTSPSTAWQTIAKVNGRTFQPGDSILFKRGDVWNESLVPPSSGTAGNSIAFDAYGTGTAPNLTGYYAVPKTAWVLVTGNVWKATVPATFSTINFCLFGSEWGQKVGASTVNLTRQGQFYLANGFVYIFSVGNPANYYNEAIVPMALSNVPAININGQSWLTLQHLLLNWFDQYGVYVEGSSDHLVFANMEADSMIPQGTQPLGFYVNESAPGPGDIKIYNSEAHLNYDAFRFDGVATGITMVNDKAYANRDGALVDNTSAVTYSYCHFYASSLAVAGSTDVLFTSGAGPIAGPGNIAADTPPAVMVYQRYPAENTLSVDDAGMTAGTDTYYASTVLPIADAAAVPVGVAITVGYPLAQTLISEFQGWVNAGRDVTSHSLSHTYYTNTDALELQYTGSGTAATLSISNKMLSITVTGASDSVTYNLAQGQAEGTIKAVRLALLATGKFTATEIPTCQGPYGTGCSAYTESALLAQDLADVNGQDVKSAVYHMQMDTTRLTTDEITLSRQWMTTNLTNLPSTPVYVYPGGYETTTMQGIAATTPYNGARGALKQDLGVKDTYADGFNVQNITSFGVNPSWMGLAPAVLNGKIQALVWKESVWGVPWGIFWHLNELTQDDPVGGTEITNLIQDFKSSGATIQTNTGLVNWLLAGRQETGTDGNDYYVFPATNMALDFRPTQNSPVVDAGLNLGAAYELDLNGVNQNTYGSGWEIGAHAFEGYAVYGDGTGTGHFDVGSLLAPGAPQLPTSWVNNKECMDNLALTPPRYEFNLATESWISFSPSTCSGITFHNPYWTVGSPTFSGLQQALTDAEACRTASGGSSGFILDIPTGFAFTGGSSDGLTIPQSSSVAATSCIVLRSTADASLPSGRVVGAHGIQDNLAGSTDILIRNPDATGQNMYFDLGPSWTCATPPCSVTNPATLGGITTISVNTTTLCPIPNGTATTLCPATTLGNLVVPLANGYVSPNLGSPSSAVVTVDTGSNQETVTPLSCPNQTGLCATFAKSHATGVCVVYNTTGCGGAITNGTGAFSLANGTATNTSAYDDAANLWTLQGQSTGASFAMSFCNAAGESPLVAPTCAGGNQGPDHWLIEDMEARMYPGNTNNQDLIAINGITYATSTAQMASHIHFDRDWLHSDWTSIATGTNAVSAALEGDVLMWSFTNSMISEIMRPGGEHHGISAQGDGQKIDHNVIESGSIPIFAGGYSTPNPSIFGYVPNCDSEVRRNNGEWPFSWLGLSSPGNPIPAGYNSNFSNWAMLRKNGYENKSGCRIVLEGNIFGDLDNSGSQEGAAIALDVRNSSNGLGNANYQATLHDATVTGNIFRHFCSGPVFQNSAYLQGGGVAYQEQNILFGNNLLYDQGENNYQCSTASGMEMSGGGGTWQGNVTISADGSHGTFRAICNADDIQASPIGTTGGCPGQIVPAGVTFTGGSCSGSPTIAFGTPNIAGGNHATGTLACSGGSFVLTMNNYGTGYTSSATATVTCSACGSLPTVTVTPLTLSNYVPVSNSTGFEVLNIVPGQPVAITQCQNPAMNTVGTTLWQSDTYLPSAAGPPSSGGSAAWSGAFSTGGVTVTFPLAGTPGASDASGYCKITTIQGGPGNNLQWVHNTVISNALHQITAGNGINNIISDGPNFQTETLIQNSIFVGGMDGWCNNPIGCGNPSIAFDFDTLNSATIDHLVWPGPGLVDTPYTAFGLNPFFPSASPSMYFPTDSYCTGSASTSSCVGFIGAMNASSMPLNLSDYHSFGLRSDSSFYAGNSEAASDATSMGPNISIVDLDQTLNMFVCPYVCGSPGPYPDN